MRRFAFVIVTALAMLVSLFAAGAPAHATPGETTTVNDRRGDAPARIDLSKVQLQRNGNQLLVRVHLSNVPRTSRQGYQVWLDSDRTQKAPDYTMRWFSLEYGSGRTKGWDVVTSASAPYGVGHAELNVNRRRDHFTFVVPMRDLRGTESIRVAASNQAWGPRGQVAAWDHLTGRHTFSDWARIA